MLYDVLLRSVYSKESQPCSTLEHITSIHFKASAKSFPGRPILDTCWKRLQFPEIIYTQFLTELFILPFCFDVVLFDKLNLQFLQSKWQCISMIISHVTFVLLLSYLQICYTHVRNTLNCFFWFICHSIVFMVSTVLMSKSYVNYSDLLIYLNGLLNYKRF